MSSSLISGILEKMGIITTWPEILLSFIILILVLYGINFSIFKISVVTLFIVLWCLIQLWIGGLNENDNIIWWTDGLLLTNSWIVITKLIIIVGSVSLLLMYSWDSISIDKRNEGSWIILILIVVLSSLLLVSSLNWLSFYLAIELQALTLFILVAIKRDSAYSTEAGLKYFVLGALSSGLFLFGCVLLYGVTGEISIQGINSVITADAGKVLITVSLLFKLSIAPFHMWAPDVYEGAPTVITALLAIVPKVAVFSILVQIGAVASMVLGCATFSIIYGSVGALNQTKIKRLLAYSGIAHMGFTLLGGAIESFESIQAGLIYIIVYTIMSICSFSIILSLNLRKDLIIEFSGLSRDNSVIAFTLGLVFLSIAGIPPLTGFLSKWFVLLAGVSGGYYLIAIMVVISSVIGGVYYVRVVQIIYFPLGLGEYGTLIWQKILKKVKEIDFCKSLLIGLTFFIVLFIIMSPNILLQMTHDAIISLYM